MLSDEINPALKKPQTNKKKKSILVKQIWKMLTYISPGKKSD